MKAISFYIGLYPYFNSTNIFSNVKIFNGSWSGRVVKCVLGTSEILIFSIGEDCVDGCFIRGGA